MAAATDVENTGTTAAADAETVTAVSPEDFRKMQERAQRFEGLLRDREVKLAEFEKRFQGIDPESVRQVQKQLEEAERKAAEADPKKMQDILERDKQKIRSEYEEKLTKTSSEVEQLRKQVKTYAVTDKVMSQITSLFNDDVVNFIKSEVERCGDLDEDGSIIFRDEKGEIEYIGASPMTPKQYGERLVAKYPSMAKSTVVGGGRDAAPGTKKPAGRALPQSPEEFWAMPNAMQLWANLSSDDRRKYAKGLKIGI